MKAPLTICAILFSITSFGQTVVIDGQDTMVCFTPEQSKFILKEVTKVEYLEEKDSINTQLLAEQDSLIQNHNEIIANKDSIIANRQEAFDVCKDDLDITRNNLDATKKDLKKQKRRTRATLGIGGTIVAVLTTLLLVK